MPDHDTIYHRLFSHRSMVVDLLREFVDPALLRGLDLEQMERENAKFRSRTGEKRRGDVIWRIPGQDGTDFFLVLFLEFQSKADRWMALRIMVYVGLFWQQLIDEERLTPDGLLPPVLPLVIFNGDPRWRKPLTLRELIGLPKDSSLWKFQPNSRYHVVDEGDYPPGELAKKESLSALLFRLEHCRQPEDLVLLVDDLIDWFRGHPDHAMLKSQFGELVAGVIGKMDEMGPTVKVPEDLLEVRVMLSERVDEWKQNLRLEGELKGELRGITKTLLRLLQKKFGPSLPEWVGTRMKEADEKSLKKWADQILFASTLEDVFGNLSDTGYDLDS